MICEIAYQGKKKLVEKGSMHAAHFFSKYQNDNLKYYKHMKEAKNKMFLYDATIMHI